MEHLDQTEDRVSQAPLGLLEDLEWLERQEPLVWRAHQGQPGLLVLLEPQA